VSREELRSDMFGYSSQRDHCPILLPPGESTASEDRQSQCGESHRFGASESARSTCLLRTLRFAVV